MSDLRKYEWIKIKSRSALDTVLIGQGVHTWRYRFNLMCSGKKQIVYKRNSPQAVRSALGTVVTPSHVVSQAVASPADILMVFPVQGEHESPFLKYPDWQTGKTQT